VGVQQADWSLVINETALDLVVTNFADSPLTIFVLGKCTVRIDLLFAHEALLIAVSSRFLL